MQFTIIRYVLSRSIKKRQLTTAQNWDPMFSREEELSAGVKNIILLQDMKYKTITLEGANLKFKAIINTTSRV